MSICNNLASNFNFRFLEYKAGQRRDVLQPSIDSFAFKKAQIYSKSSPQQQAISLAIIQDLIIGCCLPLSLVENHHFRHFLALLDCKYTPLSRRTITDKIPELVRNAKEAISKKLKASSFVSLTTDLWSDRKMRSFLGVTAHIWCESEDSVTLESYLLDCRHFKGRHTSDRIASAFEEITEEYDIRQKITFIITDNAANMKCAFKVQMPQHQSSESESETDEDCLDDEQLWQDMDAIEDADLPWSSGERLSCFAHSLQLVVNDGMKEVKSISKTISKTSKFASLLHSSSLFKDKFEAMLDTNKTIPAANSTRWNSTYKQVQAITSLDLKTLNEICSKDHADMVFSSREWNQLKELVAVLAPFSEATDLTQGEKSVTISMVVPTVLDLNTHLSKMEDTRIHSRPLIRALRQSLQKRFSGIFAKANNTKPRGTEDPFSHNVYFLATTLDPQFGLSWVDLDVTNGDDLTSVRKNRDELKKMLTGKT